MRRTAMGAVIGRPDELSALYHNPAGLVLADEWRIYISAGLSLLDTEFELQPWDRSDEFLGVTPEADGYYAPVKPSRAMGVIPMLAATGESRPGQARTLGAALYVGNATGAAFDEGAVTHYHLIDGYVVAPQVVLGAAYQLRDDLARRRDGRRDQHARARQARTCSRSSTATTSARSPARKPELVARRQRLGADVERRGVRPAAPARDVGRDADRPRRRDARGSGPDHVQRRRVARRATCSTARRRRSSCCRGRCMAGANVDVTPNLEIGAELRYWLYRQYKRQHTDVVGIFLVRELDTEKNYHDSWEISGGVRVHDLAAAPELELMAGRAVRQVAGAARRRSRSISRRSRTAGCTRARATRSAATGSARATSTTGTRSRRSRTRSRCRRRTCAATARTTSSRVSVEATL